MDHSGPLRLDVQSRLHSEQLYNHACFNAHDYMTVVVSRDSTHTLASRAKSKDIEYHRSQCDG